MPEDDAHNHLATRDETRKVAVMTDEEKRALFDKITKAPGFTKEAGIEIRDFKQGAVSLQLVPKQSLAQFLGYVHAGVVTGLADHAAGAAYASVLNEGQICLSIELKINFLAPAQGDLLVAEARVIHAGGSTGVVQTDVYGETANGRTHCATSLVTLRAITRRAA